MREDYEVGDLICYFDGDIGIILSIDDFNTNGSKVYWTKEKGVLLTKLISGNIKKLNQ